MIFKNNLSELQNSQLSTFQLEKLQFTKLLMERLTDVVLLIKSNAQVIYVNQAACNFIGSPSDKLLSMTIDNIVSDFSLEVWPRSWQTIKQQGCLYFESVYRNLENQSIPVEITASYVEYETKEYACIFIRDMRQRQQVTTSLHKANQVLERRVKELLNESRSAYDKSSYENSKYDWVKAERGNSLAYYRGLKKKAAIKEYDATQSQQVLKPSLSETVKSVNPQSIFPRHSHLSQVFNYIEANYHQPISLQDVAVAVGYCPAYLTDLVRRHTGQTVNHWIIERRMLGARTLLLETNRCVNQIAEAVGYQHEGHFFRQFRQCHGTTPQAWRKAQHTQTQNAQVTENRRRSSGEGVRVLAVPVESEPLNPEGLP
jgi:PAS domain S-box-containing protein